MSLLILFKTILSIILIPYKKHIHFFQIMDMYKNEDCELTKMLAEFYVWWVPVIISPHSERMRYEWELF